MSFFDPYVSGDRNPAEENPYFIAYCALGAAVSAVLFVVVDELMTRLVLSAAIIGLVTAISARGVRQIDPDAPPPRVLADSDGTAPPAPLVGDPLKVFGRASAPIKSPVAASAPSEARWRVAIGRHDAVRAEWLPYESDPELMLSYPALSDVREETTARFFDAMELADSLRTDEYPPPVHATEYEGAVRELARTFEDARRNARRLGMDGLAELDRNTLQKAIKLLQHANSAITSAERALYAGRAHELLTRLVDSGAIRVPRPVIFAIESTRRGAIAPADPSEAGLARP